MGFSSRFNNPVGMRSVSASAEELSVFVNPRVVKGYDELTYNGSQLVLTGNLRVVGNISASSGIAGSGSTVPGGANTNIQFNDGGGFGGNNNFSFDKTSNVVTVPDILPGSDSTYNLGSPQKRFSNVYTGDLHLKNERGDWTLYEEPDMLVVINNITGKKYKINLIPL